MSTWKDGTSIPRTAAELEATVDAYADARSSFFPGVVIADRTWVMSYDGVLGGSFNSNSATVYTARVKCSDIRPMYYLQNGDSIASLVNLTVTAALEYPIGAARQPFFFKGVRSPTIEPGALLFADPLPVEIAAGDQFRIWTFGDPATSGLIRGPGSVYAGFGYTNDDKLDLGSGSTTQVDSGTITNTTAGGMQAPQAVFGQPYSGSVKLARIPQPVIIGDSICEYGHDDRTQRRNPGWVNRWMDAHNVAHINLGKSGENAQAWGATVANQLCRYRKVMLACATAILYAEGVNDIHTRTTAQIQADMLTCATMASNRGLPFWACTITPLPTSSSDGFLTAANQTANATNEAARVPYNTWLRAGSPIDPSTKAAVAIGTGGALLAGATGHPMTGYVEVANLIESAQDSGKWANAPASGTATTVSGSANITSLTGSGWVVGQFIKGSGIPVLTTITALNLGAGTATMSYNATASASGVSVWSPLTTDGTHPSQTGISQIVAGVSIPAALYA